MVTDTEMVKNGNLTYSKSVYDILKADFGIDLSCKEFSVYHYVGVKMEGSDYYLTTRTDNGVITKKIELFEKISDYIA